MKTIRLYLCAGICMLSIAGAAAAESPAPTTPAPAPSSTKTVPTFFSAAGPGCSVTCADGSRVGTGCSAETVEDCCAGARAFGCFFHGGFVGGSCTDGTTRISC